MAGIWIEKNDWSRINCESRFFGVLGFFFCWQGPICVGRPLDLFVAGLSPSKLASSCGARTRYRYYIVP